MIPNTPNASSGHGMGKLSEDKEKAKSQKIDITTSHRPKDRKKEIVCVIRYTRQFIIR